MNNIFPNGIWPTMITPFTGKNHIDYNALEQMVEWYIELGSHGLFAVCQSSEMWHLSLEERVELARFVVQKTAARIPVIASGHISENIRDQIDELERIADTGIDGLVFVTNRLALQGEDEERVKQNIDILLQKLPPSMPLGLYECPYPYKRLLSPDLLRFCEDTERFYFLKDTSCNLNDMRAKMAAVNGRLKIYNANAATLHESYKLGLAGYSGVMANFHPHLFCWHFDNFATNTPLVLEAAELVSVTSLIERQFYPVNAKYQMMRNGIKMELYSRVKDHKQFTFSEQLEVEHVHSLVNRFMERIQKS